MTFYRELRLKNGKPLILRSGEPEDAEELLQNFIKTHEETDYLLSYPDENEITVEQERDFLIKKKENPRQVEILAFIDGKMAGSAGIEETGTVYKISHRSEFGISLLKEYWGQGIGRALTEACVECAKEAGFQQLELSVMSENDRALGLYRNVGFVEFGRNPRGLLSRAKGWQELVYMRIEL